VASKIIMPASSGAITSLQVTANKDETPLYSVAYNNKTLSTSEPEMLTDPFKVSCKCPIGTVDNAFSVRVYDKRRATKNVTQNCKCDAAYRTAPTGYTGTQGLVNFMSNGDKKMFEAMQTLA